MVQTTLSTLLFIILIFNQISAGISQDVSDRFDDEICTLGSGDHDVDCVFYGASFVQLKIEKLNQDPRNGASGAQLNTEKQHQELKAGKKSGLALSVGMLSDVVLLQPGKRVGERAISVTMASIIVTITAILLFITLVLLCGSVVLGWFMKRRLERIDKSLIGVDVHIGSLTINPFSLYVNVENLVVDNPDGYKSEYLLKLGTVVFDFDAWALFRSGFRTFRIQQLVLKQVDVNVEQYFTTSNANEILKFLSKPAEKPASKVVEAEEAGGILALFVEMKRMQVVVDSIVIEDVGTTVALGGANVGPSMRMAVANIEYDAKEDGPLEVEDVAKFVLNSVLKSARATLPHLF